MAEMRREECNAMLGFVLVFVVNVSRNERLLVERANDCLIE